MIGYSTTIGKYSMENRYLDKSFWSNEYIELKNCYDNLLKGKISKEQYISILHYKLTCTMIIDNTDVVNIQDYNDIYEWISNFFDSIK